MNLTSPILTKTATDQPFLDFMGPDTEIFGVKIGQSQKLVQLIEQARALRDSSTTEKIPKVATLAVLALENAYEQMHVASDATRKEQCKDIVFKPHTLGGSP